MMVQLLPDKEGRRHWVFFSHIHSVIWAKDKDNNPIPNLVVVAALDPESDESDVFHLPFRIVEDKPSMLDLIDKLIGNDNQNPGNF